MRKSISAFMALIIFTLSLACTMSFCPIMAEAAQTENTTKDAAPMPCHGDKSSEDKNPHTPMLSSDCLNVDLFNVDQNIDFTPDLTLDQIDFLWANLTALYNLHPQMTRLIRGPPINVASSHFNNIDLYLSTQRMRI